MTNEQNRYKTIGGRIREIREANGLSQQDLANSIGFETATAVSLIERGERKISISYLEKIADTLHTTTAHLLGEEHSKEANKANVEETIRYALRADRDLTKNDKERVVDFYNFMKKNSHNASGT